MNERQIEATRKANTTHGYTCGPKKRPEYKIWGAIKRRCYNPIVQSYPHYGGRGISVCDRWLHGDGQRSGFECFIADMGDRPPDKHSIERIDTNGNYTPDNCEWGTWTQQCRNRTNTRKVHWNGALVPLAEACEAQGLNYKTILMRIYSGWTPEEAIDKNRKRRSK